VNTIFLKAYAKINLRLDITGVREDGYHSVDMVNQSVGLHDLVSVSQSEEPGIQVTFSEPWIPKETNSAIMACQAFQEFAADLPAPGVKVNIRKSIPSRAGYGGGSADAAAVLVGLSALRVGTGQSAPAGADLMKAAAAVGSDVPFCMLGGLRRCTGKGEIVGENLGELSPAPVILLAKPKVGMSTPAAYAEIDKHYDSLRRPEGEYGNVFEELPIVPWIVHSLKEIMLRHGASVAQMSGSGTGCFAFFDSAEAAERCRKGLRVPFTEVTSCVKCGVEVSAAI
jgi:4-diphosphocytidyl-2-C-methyl-D-erythritol kinase